MHVAAKACWLATAWFSAMAPLSAQAVHLVGPGGHSQIHAALAVASQGDIVVVQAGNYDPFDLTVGVHIVAPDGATIVPNVTCQGCWSYTTLAPVGRTAHLIGLTFRSQSAVQPHVLRVQGGSVVFESCTFVGGYPTKVGAALHCANADVVVRSSAFPCTSRGIWQTSGTLLVSDCTFAPTAIAFSSIPCLRIDGGSAHVTFSDLRGASGDSGQPAILVGSNGKLTLSDSHVQGGDSYPIGIAPVAAIENLAALPVLHDRTTVVGGLGAVVMPTGLWPIPGPAWVGAESATPLVGAVGWHDGLRTGSPWSMLCRTQPNDLVVVGLTNDLVAPQMLPGIEGVVRFDAATVAIFAWGSAGPYGAFGVDVPSVPAALLGTAVWLHPIAFDGVALQAGPVVGGLVQ